MRLADEVLAGVDERAGVVDPLVAERRRLQLSLDHAGQAVPGDIEHPARLIDAGVGLVTRAAALDRLRRRLPCRGAELPDPGVELPVAAPPPRHTVPPDATPWIPR